MMKVLGSVNAWDSAVALACTAAVAVLALTGLWPWGTLLTLLVFAIGQWSLVIRHARLERHREQAWREIVVPSLKAVQTSVNRHLVSLARSPTLELATEFVPALFDDKEYRDRTKKLLDKLMSQDFLPLDTDKTKPHPLREGLENLRNDTMGPMRDLVRWGLTVERVYSAKDRESYSSRTILLAILEMVITHYLADLEAMLQTANRWPRTMPRALRPEFVEFVPFGQHAGNFRFASRAYEVPRAAARVARALDDLADSLERLELADQVPALPVSSEFELRTQDERDDDRHFCQDYLVLMWYRTVIVLLGERFVAVSGAK